LVLVEKEQIASVNNEKDRESEQSLLEQIRIKEEELHVKISGAEQEYEGVLEGARKEAEEILGECRKTAESEGSVIWQQTLERTGTEVEKILRDGENQLARDRERKNRNFSAVVDDVVRAVRNG
jgi:vacuolar-type H+-ATPase subunit H